MQITSFLSSISGSAAHDKNDTTSFPIYITKGHGTYKSRYEISILEQEDAQSAQADSCIHNAYSYILYNLQTLHILQTNLCFCRRGTIFIFNSSIIKHLRHCNCSTREIRVIVQTLSDLQNHLQCSSELRRDWLENNP